MFNHKLLNIASLSPQRQGLFSRELGISRVLAQLLLNRGINNLSDAEKFLETKIEFLHDPFSFSDMQRAVELVKGAARNKERVMLFGDYDVDGLTSLTLLKKTFSAIGIDTVHYIPHRIKEGYGLNKNILTLAKEKKIELLLTADCGTNSQREIKELLLCGIKVIVTDHHESTDVQTEPPTWPVINPKLKDTNYKYRDLAGVGVAYKFCQALRRDLLEEELDLVSLGTIADSVPLTGENRILAKEGLSRFRHTQRLGLKALMQTSGIKDKTVTADFINFILGPRINASGRIDCAEIAFKLLMSEEEDEANTLAQTVEAHNRQRQKIENQILEEACDLINCEVDFKKDKILVLVKEGWHQGVLGIVAAKLAERFYRPTILISLTRDLCKGSGRSIKNFHLFAGLLECQEYLEDFGGHSHAVGLVIARNKIEDFKKKINLLAEEKLFFSDLLPGLDIDMELNLSELNERLIRELQVLEPFGTANEPPLFYVRGLRLKSEPRLLSRDTLKFWVTDGSFTYPVIGFGRGSLKESLVKTDSFDLVYTPRIDDWQGEGAFILEAKEFFLK